MRFHGKAIPDVEFCYGPAERASRVLFLSYKRNTYKIFNYTQIKLWRIPEAGMPSNGINTPELTLTEEQRKIETLNFNPAVDNILASSSHDTLNLWDIIAAEKIYSFEVSIHKS